ncbi:uncharacterized protein TrAtP1_000963 [Trichoderma atroviride]|uniref:uncharacterized protein n=1 Tax=Hypocrea atroviridis TaxID=63577 RepID=UPI003332AA9C|nr:hypothetical protein TrAtP1_000963 [Trichoderma atroviride]
MSFQSLSRSSSRRLFLLLHFSRPRLLPHSIGAFRDSETTQRRSCVALGIQDLGSGPPAPEAQLSSVISITHSSASADTTTTTSLISAGPNLVRCSPPEDSKEPQADEVHLRKRRESQGKSEAVLSAALYSKPLVQMTPITKAYLILATIIT